MPPRVVVLLARSVVESCREVRALGVLKFDYLDDFLFSSCPLPPSSLPGVTSFRGTEVTGRVGGLLMVLPAVRVDNALVLSDVGDAVVRALLYKRDEELVAFVESSVFFVTVPIRFSILAHRILNKSVCVQVVIAEMQSA